MTEAEILRAILLAIGGSKHARALRLNSGKARDPRTGQVVTFGVPGLPDVLVLLPESRCVWLEVKSAIGRQSDAQVAFECMCSALGQRYRVVRSVEEAMEAIR